VSFGVLLGALLRPLTGGDVNKIVRTCDLSSLSLELRNIC